MFELVTAFIALFSASIFLAHAVEAYQAQKRTAAEAPATSRQQIGAGPEQMRGLHLSTKQIVRALFCAA